MVETIGVTYATICLQGILFLLLVEELMDCHWGLFWGWVEAGGLSTLLSNVNTP